MIRVLSFDPGESTGWVMADIDSRGKIIHMTGGTHPRDLKGLQSIKDKAEKGWCPETWTTGMWNIEELVVIYETFQLYPGMAKTMSWNTFYPCEVIGVLHFLFGDMVGQSPSVKKYSGGLDGDWVGLRGELGDKATEHTKDAFLHLKYFMRNGGKRYWKEGKK